MKTGKRWGRMKVRRFQERRIAELVEGLGSKRCLLAETDSRNTELVLEMAVAQELEKSPTAWKEKSSWKSNNQRKKGLSCSLKKVEKYPKLGRTR